MSGLTPSQLESFKSNGYLVITDELDAETVSELLGETHRMLDEFSLEDHPMTRFTTGEGDKQHVGDRYFLDSGGKVRFFFEEGNWNDIFFMMWYQNVCVYCTCA